jgi:FAD/FMN-containing dehydrogenase
LTTRQRLIRIARIILAGSLATTIWIVARPPVHSNTSPLVVNDITQLNPILVGEVITPHTTEEIVDAVRRSNGPITVGGARHSMGGQIAAPGALHIDMRQFDKVIDFSRSDKTVTVQSGITWRKLQEVIDPADLSVSIMQTYSNFTVGGSLSVNVHGRYIGSGPMIRSVKNLTVVLADGSVVNASPSSNADVFNAAIGGYGGIGVITEATLQLADNVRVRRHDQTMPVDEYVKYFSTRVRGSPVAIFHNGDIYPPAYKTIHAVTYDRTNDPVTVSDRLQPDSMSYGLHRFAYWVVSEWPFGKQMREHLIDPLLFTGNPVTWRNYEASYDTAELEPASRETSTYVLEEYFVPLMRFDDFVQRMRNILQRHDVNVINVSVRHANSDPGSLLAWAKAEVFAFVVYYKQGTAPAAQAEVGNWTRELIDAALGLDGSYYLPYQLHATREQFLRAYPRALEFFDVKQRLDPTDKFRNELWNKYRR